MPDLWLGRGIAGLASTFDAALLSRTSDGEDVIACLAGLTDVEKRVVSVICGSLLAIEAEQGAVTALAVVEQITMVLGASRLGDG